MGMAASIALISVLHFGGVATGAAALAEPQGCSAPVLSQATVSTTLTVVTHAQDAPQFTATTVVTVPQSWSGAPELLDNPYGSRFRDALGCFLPTFQTDYRAAAPQVTEANNSVTLTDTVTTSPDPFSPGAFTIGLWQATVDGHRVVLTPTPPDAGVQAHWSATVDTGGLKVLDRSTDPVSDSGGGRLEWHGLATGTLADLNVTTAWPERLVVDHGLSSWPRKTLAELGWNSAQLVTFIPPLLLLRRYRRQRAQAGAAAWPLGALHRVCWAGLLATVAAIVDDFAVDQPNFGALDPVLTHWFFRGYGVSDSDVLANVEVGFLLLLGAWLFFTTRQRRSWLSGTAVLVVVPGACYLGGWPRWWSGTGALIQAYASTSPDLILHADARAVGVLCLAAAPLLLAVYLLLAGTMVGMVRLWPVDRHGHPRRTDRIGNRVIVTAHLLALMLTGVMFLQIAYSADQSWRHLSILGNGNRQGQLNWIMWWILYAPHWFLRNEAGTLLVLVVVTALAAWIHAISRSDPGLFLPRTRRSVPIALLALLFAVAGVGTGGEGVTYSLPIAFTVSYVLIRAVARDRSLEAFDAAVVIDPPDTPRPGASRLSPHQGLLLDAADRRTRLRQELGALGSSGTDDPATVERRRQEISDELDGLTRRWETAATGSPPTGWRARLRLPQRSPSAPRTVITAPHPVDPGQIALRLGPNERWWDNGWAAVRAGLIPTILLIGYYTYVDYRQGGIWQPGSEFGLFESLVWEIQAVPGFLAMAFVLGSLYPYVRGANGSVKGAVLGLVVVAATVADALPTYLLDGSRYSTFLIDCLTSLAFLVLTGILLDRRTLTRHHRDLGWLSGLYRTATLRVAVSYAATLLIVAVGVWQQAHISDSIDQQQARIASEILKDARAQLTKGH